MDGSIRERLLSAEGDLLNAMLQDVHAVETSSAAWGILSRDIQQAIRSHALDDETIALVYTTTSRVGILSEGFLNLSMDEITSKLMSDLESILCKVSLKETPPPSPRIWSDSAFSPQNISASDRVQQDVLDTTFNAANPPYIATAYRWLLKNLHDPYPSNAIKQSIADDAGTDVRHVNAWFMNVRRRMGWTSTSRKRFSGSRAETVDAAYRVLVAEDPKRPLEFDVRSDFMKMKVAAEGLYSEKFKKSVLAARLDVAVKDLMARDRSAPIAIKSPVNDDEQGARQSGDAMEKERAVGRATSSALISSPPPRPELSYPSPLRSPSATPEPFSPDSSSESREEDQEDPAPPRPLAGRKRRISSSSAESKDSCDEYSIQPNKRFRPNSVAPTTIFPPSPKSPLVTTSVSDGQRDNAFHYSEIVTPNSSVSRKRRLSDVGLPPVPKRPRGLPIGPQVQMVSDPLPLPSTASEISHFEDWYKGHFELPDPVTADELDSSTLVDVAENNGWSFLGASSELSSVNLLKLGLQAGLSDSGLRAAVLYDSSMKPISAPINDYLADSDIPIYSIPSEFELSSLTTQESATDNAANSNNTLSCPPLSADCSSPTSPFENDLSHLFNIEDLLSLPKWSLISTLEHQPVESESSAFPLFPGVESFDSCWAPIDPTLPFDHNPNHPNSSSAFFDDIISQELPNIDSSLFVPLAPSSIKHSYDDQVTAEKQAKLEQLQRHLEEVRKLEAELAL